VLVSANFLAAHDFTISHTFLRFKPDALELEIKFAAETAWIQVQKTLAPGRELIVEEFETVGRPLLLAYAQTMEELRVNQIVVDPREIAVVLQEDNFIFTFQYPRASRGTLRLKEIYLAKMPRDYTSRLSVFDETNQPVGSKILNPTELVFEMVLPVEKANSPSNPATSKPVAGPATPPAASPGQR
jgi:hypothetical protein